ncbi:MAG: hypothetical protein KAR17_03265, partial [Cyclobacteriaceae bacterium]|nr:hypothetical protein [Cyclobacteriaceae bacterium]
RFYCDLLASGYLNSPLILSECGTKFHERGKQPDFILSSFSFYFLIIDFAIQLLSSITSL